MIKSGPVRWGGDRLSQTRPIPRSPDGDKKGKIGRKTAVQIFQLRVVMQGQDCMHCFTVDPPESDILAFWHTPLLPPPSKYASEEGEHKQKIFFFPFQLKME